MDLGQWRKLRKPGVYGTQGVASARNVPGRTSSASLDRLVRQSVAVWRVWRLLELQCGLVQRFVADSSGNGQWTWVGGQSVAMPQASTARKARPPRATSRGAPGGRSWIDSAGNLWLFGGVGYDSTGAVGNLNDLWRYTPSTAQWTWVSGKAGQCQRGLRHPGHRRGRQRAGRARFHQLLDRFVRQPVAVRRGWLRLNRGLGLPQRPVAVQSEHGELTWVNGSELLPNPGSRATCTVTAQRLFEELRSAGYPGGYRSGYSAQADQGGSVGLEG